MPHQPSLHQLSKCLSLWWSASVCFSVAELYFYFCTYICTIILHAFVCAYVNKFALTLFSISALALRKEFVCVYMFMFIYMYKWYWIISKNSNY